MPFDPESLGATTLAGHLVVGQLRVAVVDLLEGLVVEQRRDEHRPMQRPALTWVGR